VKVERINHDVSTFGLNPKKPLRYTAGQYIEMYLPHDNPDERGQKHWFTLSASPTEELISITTKFAGDKGSTFKKTLFSLKPSAELKFLSLWVILYCLRTQQSRWFLLLAHRRYAFPQHNKMAD